MADEPKRERGRGCAVAAAVGVLLLPLLYVLSIGPASWAVNMEYITLAQRDWFYAPVLWPHDLDFSEWLTWYVSLWLP
jgi:hypothetical protein